MTPRTWSIEGVYNLRDLGGYPTRDGRQTRWHTLLRSDSPHRLTPAAQQRLIDEGLRTVVDLRHEGEIEAAPNPFAHHASVKVQHIPIFPRQQAGSQSGSLPPTLDGLYQIIIDYRQAPVKAAVEALIDSDGGLGLVHCTAGKDRTGVVVALLLDAIGVPHETIAEDYALTGPNIAPLLDSLRRDRPPAMSAEHYERMLESNPEHMLATLRHLETRYGGSAAYLHQIGLSEDHLTRLRDKLVE